MTEGRFDATEAAWRLLAERSEHAAEPCAFCPTLEGHPPTRIRRGDFEIALVDDSDSLAPALGAAELVVYADDHEATLGTVGPDRLELLVHVWADRYRELGDRPEIDYVYVFEAPRRGVTHPHGAVHGYSNVPPRAEQKLDRAQAHLDLYETCLYCDIVAREQADGLRVVTENESFIAFVPYAPRFPHELHVLARRHACSLNDITDPERRSLAELLDLVLPAYEELHGVGAPYAMGIHQAPTDDGRRQPISHFQIEFAPALELIGGTGPELGAGVFSIDVRPEDAAAKLRAALSA
jgi:UDPglucose--hexose-1-phosphate uridylyltransferase